MSPLFMDTSYNSSGSVSAEEMNIAGLEREAEGQQTGDKGRRRQEKNRDAARKSRKKQTERADELHEEFQSLEQSNSALKKEIAALKKDLHLYTMALERHKPFCCLKASASSSSLLVSPSVDCQAGPSPPRVPPSPAAPSLSTSLTSSLGLQTCDCVESTHLSTSAPTSTTFASPTGSSTELFTSPSSVTAPYSISFSPHSLFSKDPPSLLTSRPTTVPPVCTSLLSNPVPSTSLAVVSQPQSGKGTIHESSSVSANACFSPLHPGALDAFLMKQDSFLTASSNVVPPYSHLVAEDSGLVAQGCPMNVPQLHPGQFSRNPANSSPPRSLLPPPLQDPGLQSLSAPSPASAFDLKPSHSEQVTLSSVPLLSLLTVPSPLDVAQTTSSSSDEPLFEPLPPLGDPIRDFSLSELLEVNDWILSGTSDR